MLTVAAMINFWTHIYVLRLREVDIMSKIKNCGALTIIQLFANFSKCVANFRNVYVYYIL